MAKGYLEPHPVFLSICQINVAFNTKPSLPFRASYTLCANKNIAFTIGWRKMTSKWHHVRLILMERKVLRKSIC